MPESGCKIKSQFAIIRKEWGCRFWEVCFCCCLNELCGSGVVRFYRLSVRLAMHFCLLSGEIRLFIILSVLVSMLQLHLRFSRANKIAAGTLWVSLNLSYFNRPIFIEMLQCEIKSKVFKRKAKIDLGINESRNARTNIYMLSSCKFLPECKSLACIL